MIFAERASSSRDNNASTSRGHPKHLPFELLGLGILWLLWLVGAVYTTVSHPPDANVIRSIFYLLESRSPGPQLVRRPLQREAMQHLDGDSRFRLDRLVPADALGYPRINAFCPWVRSRWECGYRGGKGQGSSLRDHAYGNWAASPYPANKCLK